MFKVVVRSIPLLLLILTVHAEAQDKIGMADQRTQFGARLRIPNLCGYARTRDQVMIVG